MKFVGALFSCWLIGAASGAPVAPSPATAAENGKTIEALIADLSSDRFEVRETASKKLWNSGETALEALRKTAEGNDPEAAYRSLALLRYIELHITPDTDPAVIEQVEKYQKGTNNEKSDAFVELRKMRAWRQMLKLFAAEKDVELRENLSRNVDGVAIEGAREQILAGKPDAAKEFLELAPANARNLMALAEFHRSHGSLAAEIEKAVGSEAPGAANWRLALYRANGDFESARVAASEAEDPQTAALMAMLGGDPIPWMRYHLPEDREQPEVAASILLRIKHWEGKPLKAADLEPVTRRLATGDEDERWRATGLLFLLGEPVLAEKSLIKLSPIDAFSYFESLERIPEALAALGLDPAKPDFQGWAAQRFEAIRENEEHHEEMSEILLLASFLDSRGLDDEIAKTFDGPVRKLSEGNNEAFTELLGQLFSGSGSPRPVAPHIGKRVGIAWAGDDPVKWDELVNYVFEENTLANEWWTWLAEIDPAANRLERFEGLLALFDVGSDPTRLREKWLDLAWIAIAGKPEAQRADFVRRVAFLSSRTGDVKTSLTAWDTLPEELRTDDLARFHHLDLSAANRWDEASELFLKMIATTEQRNQTGRPDLRAFAAASLRRAGREKEAVELDGLVEKLALGEPDVSIRIGHAYAYGGDYTRAREWWKRAAFETSPESFEFGVGNEFSIATGLYAEALLEQGKWRESAAISEGLSVPKDAVSFRNEPGVNDSPTGLLRMRIKADLPYALSLVSTDRKAAVLLLDKTHSLLPSDGSLADEFFPLVRQTGLIEEHDRWFEQSWKAIDAAVKLYPAAENTRNTAAWLASRAMRHLDEAETHLKAAIDRNPQQPAYLDTMAEIQFARGNRKAALEWSQRSVNFAPTDEMIRRQHQRFESAPFPK